MYYSNAFFSIYYEKYGNSKDTIIILPGWGNTRETFSYLITSLSKDYTIYIFDYPGFGNSIVKEENLTIYDYALTFREIIKELNISNPIIIAHSFGGRIATLLSGYYKEPIKKQIFIDVASIKPKPTLKSIFRKYSYKVLKYLTKLFPKRLGAFLRNKLYKVFSSNDYYHLPDTMKKTFQNIVNEDLTKYLKDIPTETLLLWGEVDDATPLRDAYIMEKEIKNSALIIFEKASHYSYLDYPYLTLKIIIEFLKEKA